MHSKSLPASARGLKQCQHCLKPDADDNKLLTCSKCKRAHYCNSDCQRADWPTHKPICKMNQETREAIKNDPSTALAGAELHVKRWIQLTRPVLNWAVVQALAIPETPERIHTHLLCVTVHPNFSVDTFPKKDKEILRAYKVQSAVVQGIREFRDAAKPDLQTGIDEVLNHLRSRGAPSHYPDSLGFALVAIVIPAMRMTRVVPFGVEGPANELPPVFPDWEAELTRRINEGITF